MSSTTQIPISENTGLERQVLTPAGREFLQQLHRRFEPTRQELLKARRKRQEQLDRGEQPDFLESTREIRKREWRVAPIPADLQDRRVEITGPTDRKMLINALNSGANVFMADFEDANSPTWNNCLEVQQNLRDAVAGTIEFVSPEGKEYRVKENPAVLFVRPRGWHLNEKHFTVDDAPISASLFDFGLFFFHNATALVKRTPPRRKSVVRRRGNGCATAHTSTMAVRSRPICSNGS
jgi:malate synthase